MNEKYYKTCQSAEEESYGVVRLTEDEYKAVVKFLTQIYRFSGRWCGKCRIGSTPYETEDEAEKSSLD